MLKQRMLTAVALIALLVWVLTSQDRQLWSLFLLAVAALAADEWSQLQRGMRLPRGAYPVVTVVLLALLVDWPLLRACQPWLLALACGFWVLVVPLWLRQRWVMRQRVASALVGWLVILPCALALQLLRDQGEVVLFATMAVIWVSDIAAYFSGRRFGRHRLAPAISPGKTWEGVAGALLAVLLFGVLLCTPGPWHVALQPLQLAAGMAWFPALALLAVLGIEGDLFESWIKRCAGAKDSGWVLPGHGGVLDRIDALTAALPMAALLLQAARWQESWIQGGP